MREIKFRGIRIDNNKWIHGSYFLDNSGEDEGHYIKDDVDLMDYEIFPQTVGQYTGLKDENGVELYENDIVRQRITRENISMPIYKYYQVVFSEGLFTKKSLESGHIFSLKFYSNYYELAGNIYENPELMEAK